MAAIAQEEFFCVKCHACGQPYLVRRDRKLGGQEKFLAQGPRCINTLGNVDTSGRGAYYGVVPKGQMCGAPLGRGMFRGVDDRWRQVTREQLLGWTVARREHVFTTPPPPVERVVEVDRVIDTEETAELRREIERLRTKYETPCPLTVQAYGPNGEHLGLRPCGGFLGHAGQCAEVW